MSKELADKVDRDLEASSEAKKRIHEARTTLTECAVDWQDTLRTYRDDANQPPDRIVHPAPLEPVSYAEKAGSNGRNMDTDDETPESARGEP